MDTDVIGRRRAVPLAVLMLVGLLAALLTTIAPHEDANASEPGGHHHGHAAASHTASQRAFHDQMRKLWEDHVT